MPYRAQMGGVFGSGLYPSHNQGNQASEIIDSVTRGATTLIQGAYARAQRRREQDLQDNELARRDRMEQRQVEQDAFNRDMAVRKEARESEAQQRSDAAAGYTPSRIEEKETVEPGSVESNGAFGRPGRVTGPSIKKQKLTIPAALDYTKSTAYRARQQTHDIHETERAEHIEDATKIHSLNRQSDVKNPLPSRARTGGAGGGNADAVHAATQTRAQLAQVNARIKTLETQRAKLAPDQLEQDKAPAAEIDKQLEVLHARGDSIQTVNDRIGGQLTDKAGVPRTIGDSLKGKPPKKKPAPKQTISEAEAVELRRRGFKPEQIAERYTIK